MDHLPYPENAVTPKFEVPYICGDLEDYDSLGFFEYPVRRGWCQSTNKFGWMDCSQEMAARRAQNWLYFGLLREILGKTYSKDRFLKRIIAEDGYFIDTRKLPGYLDNWTKTINRYKIVKGTSWRLQILGKSEEIFTQANLNAEILERLFLGDLWQGGFESKISSQNFFHCHKVTLAIKVLLQTMRIAASNIGGLGERPSTPSSDKLSAPRILISQMVQRRLCSKQIQDFHQSQSAAVNIYLAALPRPVAEGTHQACTLEKCVANNVDVSRYKTQHTEDQCECRLSGPNAVRIGELIQDGEIPLVALGVSPTGDPEFEVVKAQPGTRYTAISHVWSGGLGNFQTNELPRCQLLHLHDALLKLRDFKPQESSPGYSMQWKLVKWDAVPRWNGFVIRYPVFRIRCLSWLRIREALLVCFGFPVGHRKERVMFWMDTLCIVGEADSVVRAKAIAKMALTYAAAENVLVLDPELQTISQEGLSQEQICAHVMCCAWLTRSWTMQEARLSRKWFALFADGFFDPVKPEERANSGWASSDGVYKSASNLKAEFAREVIHWYNSMPVMRRHSVFLNPNSGKGHPLVYFIQAWNELGQRSTSQPKDALGIFANMLNLSASEVMALPPEQRMKAIIRTQETIPFHLIYSPVPKIQDPHNRWIPDFPGEYSLHLNYGVLHPSTGEIELKKSSTAPVGFIVDPSNLRTERLKLVDPTISETVWIEHYQDAIEVDSRAPGCTMICYLLSDLASARLHPRRYHRGARFGVQKRQDTTLYLVYEHGFEFRLQNVQYDGSDPENDSSDFTVVEAVKTTANQTFQLVIGKYTVTNDTLLEI